MGKEEVFFIICQSTVLGEQALFSENIQGVTVDRVFLE